MTYLNVLFVCTGNFYRSRFAEAVFNHLVQQLVAPSKYRAFSRGLRITGVHSSTIASQGELSKYTRSKLEELQIELHHTATQRCSISLDDVLAADIIICMDRDEHLEMMEAFLTEVVIIQISDPALLESIREKIEYWEFQDIGRESHPNVILPQIHQKVIGLVERLKSQ